MCTGRGGCWKSSSTGLRVLRLPPNFLIALPLPLHPSQPLSSSDKSLFGSPWRRGYFFGLASGFGGEVRRAAQREASSSHLTFSGGERQLGKTAPSPVPNPPGAPRIASSRLVTMCPSKSRERRATKATRRADTPAARARRLCRNSRLGACQVTRVDHAEQEEDTSVRLPPCRQGRVRRVAAAPAAAGLLR